jgi:hypothetical protein
MNNIGKKKSIKDLDSKVDEEQFVSKEHDTSKLDLSEI